jgi:hypothetical protein
MRENFLFFGKFLFIKGQYFSFWKKFLLEINLLFWEIF